MHPATCLVLFPRSNVLESPVLPTGITSAPSSSNHLISPLLLPGGQSLSLWAMLGATYCNHDAGTTMYIYIEGILLISFIGDTAA